MSTNWEQLEKDYKKEFKQYAPLGNHKAKVEKATVSTTTTGSIRVVFEFQDGDEYKYPKSAAHWVSRKNINWTKWHHMNLLKVLGVSEENAKKDIDRVEKDGVSLDQIVKGYQALYDRACSRHPEVEIEVREQYDRKGNKVMSEKGYAYTESEFTDRSVYNSNIPKGKEDEIFDKEHEYDPQLLGGEEINIDETPF